MTQTVLIAILSALLGAYLFYFLTKLLLRLKLKKRFERASVGEGLAEEILAELGYTLEETQKSSYLSMWINGEEFSYLVRPDAFAVKDTERYLVEVKTGKVATNPKHTATRRQLLEYFHGFDVDGVLLIDADSKLVHQIHFEAKRIGGAVNALPKKKELRADDLLEPSGSKRALLWAFLIGFIAATIMVLVCR